MKCSNCTTELWGHPAICPVCGTPTGLNRRSSRQTPPPWSTSPAPPKPDPQPARSPSQSQPFFNAADLLDPEVVKAVPQAPGNVGIFSTAPLVEEAPAAEPQQGMLNAADLFDPEILADLTGIGTKDERRSTQSQAEAPAQDDDYPAFLVEPGRVEEVYEEEEENTYRQQPSRPFGGPIAPPPPAAGPLAPPLFSLTALPSTGPQPTAPPPPPPSFPFREPPMPAGPPMPPPEEWGRRPSRGYKVVSGPPPISNPPGRPPMPPPGTYPAPPGMYPAGAPTMPAPPASKLGPRPARSRRRFFSTLGGLTSLALVLAIIGGALLLGAVRLFQLQSLIAKPTVTTPGPLPTVAPKDGYTIVPDHALGFSLQYANDWKKLPDYDANDKGYQGVLFQAGPNTGFEVGSSPLYAGWSPAQIDDYVLAHPFPLSNVTAIQTFVPSSPTVHIDNFDWTAEDANLTVNRVNVRLACLAIKHNGRGYVIFYYGTQNVFNSNYSQYFEPMLLSFRFLDG